MKAVCVPLLQQDDGQNLIEYALLAGLIAVVALMALTNIGTNISTLFTTIANSLNIQ